jgi:hypothetical protein
MQHLQSPRGGGDSILLSQVLNHALSLLSTRAVSRVCGTPIGQNRNTGKPQNHIEDFQGLRSRVESGLRGNLDSSGDLSAGGTELAPI